MSAMRFVGCILVLTALLLVVPVWLVCAAITTYGEVTP